MFIKSLQNNHIKNLIKLKEKKHRDLNNKYLVEGYHLVEEAIKENLVEEIILLEGEEYYSEIKTITVDQKIMKKLSDLETIPKIMAVVEKKDNPLIGSNVIILEAIQDPGNLGTIIRSAKAFNVDTIILGKECVDLYNPKVLRATQGMIFHTNILTVKDLKPIITELKDQNYLIMGTKVDGGNDIKKLSFKGKIAIIIGNEGNGMSREISDLCDEFLYIRMHKDCESLNAAVACSILMYEVFNK